MGRVKISQKIKKELQDHSDRTQLSAHQFAALTENRVAPQKVSGALIHGWMNGKIDTANEDNLDYVLQTWRQLPDFGDAAKPLKPKADKPHKNKAKTLQKTEERIKLTEKRVHALQAELARVQMPPAEMLKHAGEKAPRGLSDYNINAWASGKTQTVPKAHYDFTLSYYQALKPYRQTLTQADRDMLKTALDLSGLYIKELVRLLNRDGHKEISDACIYGWISGKAKTAKCEDINRFLKACQYASKYKKQTTHKARVPRDQRHYIELTPDRIEKLREQRDRTGLAGRAFFATLKTPAPKNMTDNILQSWLSGQVSSVDPELYKWVLSRYRRLKSRDVH